MEYIGIFFGWVLGIISILITELFRNKIKGKETAKSVKVELLHLRFKMALAAYTMNSRLGVLSKEFLLWMNPIIQSYNGPEAVKGFREAFNDLTKMDDNAIKIYSESGKNDQIMTAIKRHSLPFFESRVASLSLLSESLQLYLFEIKSRLELINQDVDRYWYYFEKTFDSSLSELNNRIIIGNINKQYHAIADQSRILVDTISKVL